MSQKRQNVVQILVLVIIMVFIILAVVLIYYYRFNVFTDINISSYGTYSQPEVGPCIVEGKTPETIRCTDVGTQVSVSRCVPNPNTGFYCLVNNQQTSASRITTSKCVPSCISFLWDEKSNTPCLVKTLENKDITLYKDVSGDWCHDNKEGVRFRTYECKRHDGSGLNTCTFTCDSNVFNADCFKQGATTSSNGVTLLYNPAILPTDSTVDLLKVGNEYLYEPISKANIAFPVIASNVKLTREPCTDLGGIVCGDWIKSKVVAGVVTPDTTQNNNFDLSFDCNIVKKMYSAVDIGYLDGDQPYYYNAAAVNTVYDIVEPGIKETVLTCFSKDGTLAPRCNPEPEGCYHYSTIFQKNLSGSYNIVDLLPLGSGIPAKICGTYSGSGGSITSVSKGASTLRPCILANPNFSLDPNLNLVPTKNKPIIDKDKYQFELGSGIFGVPLFLKSASDRNLYLSLMNVPCPSYTISNEGPAIFFNFPDPTSFITPDVDPIPVTGIPFLFDCKGNPYKSIENTPCSWIEDVKNNPATIWGLDSKCNTRVSDISPIIEQSALMLMIRPAIYTDKEIQHPNIIKCNIFVIFGGDYIGWLSWQTTINGYRNGDAARHILVWTQGRFDPYGNAINLVGNRIEDLPNANFYLSNIGNFTYNLFSQDPITEVQVFDGINNTASGIGSFTFVRATSNGLPVITTTNSNNVINDTTFSNFLYSRRNRGGDTRFPACNIFLQKTYSNIAS